MDNERQLQVVPLSRHDGLLLLLFPGGEIADIDQLAALLAEWQAAWLRRNPWQLIGVRFEEGDEQ